MSMTQLTYPDKDWRADLLFLVVLLIAASNYIVVKQAMLHVPPFTLLAVRYSLAILIISLLFFSRRKYLSRKMLAQSGLLGVLLSAAVVSWQLGVQRVDQIGPAAFIVSLDGLMVPLFAYLLFGTALSPSVLVAIPVALLGLALLSLRQDMSLSTTDTWFILSAVGFSLHILLTHHYGKSFDAICFSWGQMLVVSVITLVAAFSLERDEMSLTHLALVKYQIIYLAVVATAIRLSLQNFVQQTMSPTRTGFLFTTEPILVALSGWLVLSQAMSFQQLLGCGLIFMAVLRSHQAKAAG